MNGDDLNSLRTNNLFAFDYTPFPPWHPMFPNRGKEGDFSSYTGLLLGAWLKTSHPCLEKEMSKELQCSFGGFSVFTFVSHYG